MDRDEVQGEIPTWRVTAPDIDGANWLASSPTIAMDGVLIAAPTPHLLIQRVRDLEMIMALAMERAGRLDPQGPVVGRRVKRTPDVVLVETVQEVVTVTEEPHRPGLTPPGWSRTTAKASGFTGDPCDTCGALMLVQNGTCLKCMSCGTTTGCS